MSQRPGDSIEHGATQRPPPRVVVVPRPRPAPRKPGALLIVFFAVAFMALLMRPGRPVLGLSQPVFIGLVGAVLIGLHLLGRRRYRRKLAGQPHEPPLPDSLAQALRDRWASIRELPTLGWVGELLEQEDPGLTRCGYVVTLGVDELPEVDDVPFEPEIISPGRVVRGPLILAGIGLSILAVWMLQFIPGLHFDLELEGFACILIPAAAAGLIVVWATIVRPMYVRIAPGVVEVLAYSMFSSRPRVRSFPIEPGTLAVLVRRGGELSLHLKRGAQRELIVITSIQGHEELWPRLWQALTSRRPIPHLPSETLIG